MSMTKRYLESLPQAEQDAILGGIDNAYISPDESVSEKLRQMPGLEWLDNAIAENDNEWTDDAENEPTDEELAEWARALVEEDEQETFIKFLTDALAGATGEGPISVHVRGSLALLTELRNYSDDGPIYEARYYHKLASWPIAFDKFTERDEAPLMKRQPPGVKAGCYDV